MTTCIIGSVYIYLFTIVTKQTQIENNSFHIKNYINKQSKKPMQ